MTASAPSPVRGPIVPALDVDDDARALALAAALGPRVRYLKLGSRLFVRGGPALVQRLLDAGGGASVFLDLKFHDIPSTVAGAVRSAVDAGAGLLTVHALGGRDMIAAAVEAAAGRARVVAVTVLTSHDPGWLASVGLGGSIEDAVLRLAGVALDAGADGLVCSPAEVAPLRARFGAAPWLVVPGIRPAAVDDDQARTATPAAALAAGATLLVVGRPLLAAADARAALDALTPPTLA